MANKDKSTTRIYIFGYKFVITSEPIKNGWSVTVSLGGIKQRYTDYTEDRTNAEEACFGYFLIEHCQGGIFWQEPSEKDKQNLLAERINSTPPEV